MKINRFIIFMTLIVAVVSLPGCNKEETIAAGGDKAPEFAAKYIGLFKIEYPKNNFPFKREDSVVFLIDQGDYELYIGGLRKTLVCDSQGFLTYNTESKTIFLILEDRNYDLCDTLRIPHGLFNATVTESAFNFDGFRVLPGATDTIWYEFRLIVPPPG